MRRGNPNLQHRGGRFGPSVDDPGKAYSSPPSASGDHKTVIAKPGWGQGVSYRRHKSDGRRGGPARETNLQVGGQKRSPRVRDSRTPQSRCQTGRRTGAGTRAIRSHLPRRAPGKQRHPANPPSTRHSHSNASTNIVSPVVPLMVPVFRRLVSVTAALLTTRPGVLSEKRRTS